MDIMDNNVNGSMNIKGGRSGKTSFYRAAAALLLALLVASGVMAGYYARMRYGGGDPVTADTASFDITQEGEYSTAIDSSPIAPGMTVEKSLTITNRSETAMDCTFRLVDVTCNLPLVISLEKDGTELPGTQTGSAYSSTVRLEPGSGEVEFEIVLSWPEDENSDTYSGMVDYIKVTLEAVQAQ